MKWILGLMMAIGVVVGAQQQNVPNNAPNNGQEKVQHWTSSVNEFLDSLKLKPEQVDKIKNQWNKFFSEARGYSEVGYYVNQTGNVVAYVDKANRTKNVVTTQDFSNTDVVAKAINALSGQNVVVFSKDGKELKEESRQFEGQYR